MGLEQREFVVAPPTATRVALGDLPRLVLYKADGTPYQQEVFDQAAAQADVAALTSSAATGGDAPTEGEHNAVRADLVATRTVLNSLLAKLRTAGIIAT